MNPHAVSHHGFCACGELRPCRCGDFCPSCKSDVVEDDAAVRCTRCTWSLVKRPPAGMTYPQTAAEAIAFIGNHYAQMHEAPDPLDTRFLLSVHDLLSAFRWAAGQGQVVDQDKLLDQVIAAWLAPPLLTDAQRAAIATGYESGTLATDPGALGATIHLHYASGPEAEAAFDAITRIIDALVAHSGIPASARQETP